MRLFQVERSPYYYVPAEACAQAMGGGGAGGAGGRVFTLHKPRAPGFTVDRKSYEKRENSQD